RKCARAGTRCAHVPWASEGAARSKSAAPATITMPALIRIDTGLGCGGASRAMGGLAYEVVERAQIPLPARDQLGVRAAERVDVGVAALEQVVRRAQEIVRGGVEDGPAGWVRGAGRRLSGSVGPTSLVRLIEEHPGQPARAPLVGRHLPAASAVEVGARQ